MEKERQGERGAPGKYTDIDFLFYRCASLSQESSSAWSDKDSWSERVEELVALLLNSERAAEHACPSPYTGILGVTSYSISDLGGSAMTGSRPYPPLPAFRPGSTPCCRSTGCQSQQKPPYSSQYSLMPLPL